MSKNNVAKKKTNAKKRPKKINANVDIKKAATIQRTKISSSSQTGPFPEIINNLKNSTPAIPLTSIALSADSNVELLSLKDHWRSIKSNCKNYPNIYSYAKKLKAEAKLSKKALKASVRETRKQKMAFTDYQVKINKLITCSICFDIYSQPHVLECGHVHCYFCLQNWIATCEHNGSCPTCRKSLSVVPIPSISVQQLVDLSIEGLDAEAKATAVKRLMDDKLKLPPNNSLWKDWVKTGNRYIDDNDDDVGRFLIFNLT